MPRSLGDIDYLTLPTPVARLVHQAFLTPDHKKRHDYLVSAWDVTFRIIVANEPPADVSVLATPSIGVWRSHLRLPDVKSKSPELLEFVAFLRDELGLPPLPKKAIGPQDVVEHIPTYRNNFTTAHLSPRSDDFYSRTSYQLAAGLVAAWKEGFLLPRDATLVFVRSVGVNARGEHIAHLYRLEGLEFLPEADETRVPRGTRPERVYARRGTTLRSLHPWVVCLEERVRPRFLLFHSANRGPAFLDCDSGDLVPEARLASEGVHLVDPTRLQSPSVPPPPPASGRLIGETPLPGAASAPRSPSADAPSPEPQTPPDLRPAATPRRQPRRVLALAVTLLLLAGFGIIGVVLAAKRPILAPVDWFFEDEHAGTGWLQRCREHLRDGQRSAAAAACLRAFAAAPAGSVVRTEVSRELGKTCGVPREDADVPGALGAWMLIPPDTGLELVIDPGDLTRGNKHVNEPTCSVLGSPGITKQGEILFHVVTPGLDADGNPWRDWYVPAAHVANRAAQEHAGACDDDVASGRLDEAKHACFDAVLTTDVNVLARAARNLSTMYSTLDRLQHSLAWAIVAYRARPDADSARRLDELCRTGGPPRQSASDTRRLRVVSYPWADRRYRMRTGPGVDQRELRMLPFATCLLVDDDERGGYVNAEARVGDADLVGWVHRDWLYPR